MALSPDDVATLSSDAGPPPPTDPQITVRPHDATMLERTQLSPASPRPISRPLSSKPSGRGLPVLSVDLDGPLQIAGASSEHEPDLEVKGLLGEGGMGRVLLARQHSLSRDVAIKTIRANGGDNERSALLAEGAIVGFLEHPSIIPVHALGLDASGRPVLVMKRVDGVEWAALLDDGAHPSWPKTMADASDRRRDHLEILMQVCGAVQFAHEQGILHRDVKPANVLVGQYGDVYLADWGVAYRLASKGRISLAGTPAYMAPEMVAGGPLDARTDVYLLGATLHHLLTGQPRHVASTVRETLAHAEASAPFTYAADVPADLAKIANDATAKDPAARPATAMALRQRLRDHLRHLSSVSLTDAARARFVKLEELARTEANDDEGRIGEVDLMLAETRFGLKQALEQWPDNDAAKAQLDALEALAAERRARGAELARRAREHDPTISVTQRKLATAALAVAGIGLSVFTILLGPTHVPTSAELLATGCVPALTMTAIAVVLRRALFRTALNRANAATVLTVVWMVLIGRALAVHSGMAPERIVVMDSLIIATAAFVGASVAAWWIAILAALMLLAAVVGSSAPQYAAFAFSITTGGCLLSAVAIMSRGAPAKPPG